MSTQLLDLGVDQDLLRVILGSKDTDSTDDVIRDRFTAERRLGHDIFDTNQEDQIEVEEADVPDADPSDLGWDPYAGQYLDDDGYDPYEFGYGLGEIDGGGE